MIHNPHVVADHPTSARLMDVIDRRLTKKPHVRAGGAKRRAFRAMKCECACGRLPLGAEIFSSGSADTRRGGRRSPERAYSEARGRPRRQRPGGSFEPLPDDHSKDRTPRRWRLSAAAWGSALIAQSRAAARRQGYGVIPPIPPIPSSQTGSAVGFEPTKKRRSSIQMS